MSMDPFEKPSEEMQPLPKQGMSTGSKVLLILGIVFGGLFLLCCGGVVVFMLYMRQYAADNFSEDPVRVVEVTDTVTQIDVPEGLDPTVSMNMKIPFSDQSVMVMVFYADKDTQSVLCLISMGEAFGPQNQQQMRQSLDQQLRAQGFGDQEDIVIEESRELELEIRGQPVTFTIAKGTGRNSQTARIQANGVFEGEQGPVMLVFEGDAETYPEETVVKMLESIE
ncbi:MAG: hypothetical protein JXL80_08610 [Planctomycetes bacterium]|nr:hypothetical protein [Planctomycetota bacterium]